MSVLMDMTFVISGVNIILLGLLLYPAVRNLRRTRSTIAAGLMVFAAIFLVESFIAMFFNFTMMPFYTTSVEPQVFALSVLKMLSFGTLVWITYS